MHHNTGQAAQILGGSAEDGLHVGCGNPGIRALEGHPCLRRVHLRKCAGHTHIDFPQSAVALLLRLADGLADLVIQFAGVIPAFLQVSVVGCNARAHDVAALASAVLGDQGDDFARTEINGRYRGLHRSLIPPVSRGGPSGLSACGRALAASCPLEKNFLEACPALSARRPQARHHLSNIPFSIIVFFPGECKCFPCPLQANRTFFAAFPEKNAAVGQLSGV